MPTQQGPAFPAMTVLNAILAEGLKELIVLPAKVVTSKPLIPIVILALLIVTPALQTDH